MIKIKAPLVFIDTETTGLDLDRHEVWEIAIIQRMPDGPDVETVYQVTPDLAYADARALEIGRFHDRFKVPPGANAAVIDADGRVHAIHREAVRLRLDQALRGAVLVGSNTAFDASFMRKFLHAAPWHYRVVNAVELAAGALLAWGHPLTLPWSSADVSERVGVAPPPAGEAHQALVDARWARDVFDAAAWRA